MATRAPTIDETAHSSSGSLTAGHLVTQIALVGLIDVLILLAFVRCVGAEWWLAAGFFAVLFAAVNLTYFTRWAIPLKYLLPGLAFLVVFQLYTMIFTGYASFTNYGTGHLEDKAASIVAVTRSNVLPVDGSTQFAVVPVADEEGLFMLVSDPDTGEVRLGSDAGFESVAEEDLERDGEQVTGVAGFRSLDLAAVSADPLYRAIWAEMRVPLDEEAGTYLRPISISKATTAEAGFVYDGARDAMVSSATGAVYEASEEIGNFVAADGQRLTPGWRVGVGLANYVALFTDATIRSSFLPIMLWTFFFAFVSTGLNFSVGLMLALVLADTRMRGQAIYRLLLIIPFGLPGILTILVWKGMLNTDFGLINQVLGAEIPWLTEPYLARFSVLMVNLWMGFPYFFLVCSGALTAIPTDLKEAAFIDGASGRYTFRTVVLPLILVATAPLLVTTFAFNFNNYALIELLTQGGPFPRSVIDGGSTDLLINYTFRTAFNDSNQQLGLASAIAMVIFVIVGTVSAYGFRLTKRLEEIKG